MTRICSRVYSRSLMARRVKRARKVRKARRARRARSLSMHDTMIAVLSRSLAVHCTVCGRSTHFVVLLEIKLSSVVLRTVAFITYCHKPVQCPVCVL